MDAGSLVFQGLEVGNLGDLLRMKSCGFRVKVKRPTFHLTTGGFDANHPHLNLLFQKDFLLTKVISNEMVLSLESESKLSAFQSALPFMQFMDGAMLE